MANLSPQALAVLDAACSRWPRSREWIIAAALRAAADQVVPKEKAVDYVLGAPQAYALQRRATRQKLLAIADELEGGND